MKGGKFLDQMSDHYTTQEIHSVSVTKVNLLMLRVDIILAKCGYHKEYINTLCGFACRGSRRNRRWQCDVN